MDWELNRREVKEGNCDHMNDDYLLMVSKPKRTQNLFPHSSNKLLIGLALSIIVPKDKSKTYPTKEASKS